MQLPELPLDKCVNHPDRKAVGKRLCAPCLEKWNKLVLDFEADKLELVNNE